MHMNTPVETYPLLMVIDGAAVQAGDYGMVEAQLVLKSWNEPPLTDELKAALTEEAARCANWALNHRHLDGNGSWIVVACTDRPGVALRLELISWDVVGYYQIATRH